MFIILAQGEGRNLFVLGEGELGAMLTIPMRCMMRKKRCTCNFSIVTDHYFESCYNRFSHRLTIYMLYKSCHPLHVTYINRLFSIRRTSHWNSIYIFSFRCNLNCHKVLQFIQFPEFNFASLVDGSFFFLFILQFSTSIRYKGYLLLTRNHFRSDIRDSTY